MANFANNSDCRDIGIGIFSSILITCAQQNQIYPEVSRYFAFKTIYLLCQSVISNILVKKGYLISISIQSFYFT